MKYFFYGNNELALKSYLDTWKQGFIEKFGEENFLDIKNYEDPMLLQNIAISGSSLFQEKRLIILNNIPASSDQKNKNQIHFQETLYPLLDEIHELNIVVFVAVNPDKRSKLFKKLQTDAKKDDSQVTIKTFEVKNENESMSALSTAFPHIDIGSLKRIYSLKGGNLLKVHSEIEKLLITYEKLSPEIIDAVIFPEFEESIFHCIEDIIYGNTKALFSKLQSILSQSETIPFYYGLISNLRLIVYIGMMKDMKKTNSQITQALKLGNRTFLLDKYKSADFKKICRLYTHLLEIDEKMKTGKLGNVSENPLRDELECILLEYV